MFENIKYRFQRWWDARHCVHCVHIVSELPAKQETTHFGTKVIIHTCLMRCCECGLEETARLRGFDYEVYHNLISRHGFPFGTKLAEFERGVSC